MLLLLCSRIADGLKSNFPVEASYYDHKINLSASPLSLNVMFTFLLRCLPKTLGEGTDLL